MDVFLWSWPQFTLLALTFKTPDFQIEPLPAIVHDADNPAFDYPEKIVTRSDVNVLFPTLREHLGIPLFVADKYPDMVVYADNIKRQYLAGDIMFMVYGVSNTTTFIECIIGFTTAL